jgi:hypothetical protein
LIADSFFQVLLSKISFLPLFNDRRPIEMKTFSVFVCETLSYLEQVKVYIAAGSALETISESIANLLLVGPGRNVLKARGEDHIEPSFLHRLISATREFHGSNVLSEAPRII